MVTGSFKKFNFGLYTYFYCREEQTFQYKKDIYTYVLPICYIGMYITFYLLKEEEWNSNFKEKMR